MISLAALPHSSEWWSALGTGPYRFPRGRGAPRQKVDQDILRKVDDAIKAELDWLNFSAGLTLRIGRGICGGMMRTYLTIVASLWAASVLSAAQDLEFEVASVRDPTPPPWVGLMKGGPGTSDAERISYSRVAMGSIIKAALYRRYSGRLGWPGEHPALRLPRQLSRVNRGGYHAVCVQT